MLEYLSKVTPMILSFGSAVVGVLLIFLSMINFIFKNYFLSKYFGQIVGTALILSLAFAANNVFIYAISIIIIATLVTESEFLEKLMALIWDRPEFWKYKVDILEQNQESKDDPDKLAQLSSDLKISTERQKQLENLLNETSKNKQQFELLYHFEKTYRIIFGSQLMLLVVLKNHQNINVALAEAIYRRNVLRSFQSSFTFDNYISFLINSYLITRERDTLTITPLGTMFLDYLNGSGISMNKGN